jgi:5'-methylthioadenosine phosphorylase
MRLGVIGGSGLYEVEELAGCTRETLETPFGAPSDAYGIGTIGRTDVCFLPRHGIGHRLLPSEINHRANIHGFKQLGVNAILAFSAVGSLREEIRPRDILLPDQYYDRTKQNYTFFGHGVAAHIPFGDPVCPTLHTLLQSRAPSLLAESAGAQATLHGAGTYVNMEGPAFSTRAESETYRRLGFDVIGMTSLPEAKLCREAGICYSAVALVTDYDCWHTTEDVNVEMVVENVRANTAFARALLVTMAGAVETKAACGCADSLAGAVMTHRESIPDETAARLALILPAKS